MRDQLRETVLSIRDLLATAVPFVILAMVLLALAYWRLDPAPPRTVVLATGQDQGAYAVFGKRYVELLKQDGIQVRLRKTAGAAENTALLRQPDGDVDIAFFQGGADEAQPVGGDESDVPDDGLVSLGGLFYEPVWLFYRSDAAERLLHAPELTSLTQLVGWRVNIGAPGSGVPNVMEAPVRGESHRPGNDHAGPRAADAGGRGPARGPRSTRSSSRLRPSRCWCRCCCRRRAFASSTSSRPRRIRAAFPW